MLWPPQAETRLVSADHGDIIGHYDREPRSARASGRQHDVYDLLGSGSGFTQTQFETVWEEIFAFCSAPATGPRR